MLLVVIKPSKDSDIQKQLCEDQVAGLDAEVVVDQWENCLSTPCEYICFLDEMFMLSRPAYFKKLLNSFTNKPNYLKLAMVCPSMALNSWDKKLYGYLVSPSSVLPSNIKSSKEKYNIQIGLIPGAIIRRSSLGKMGVSGDQLDESIKASLAFWSRGLYVEMDPQVTYFSTKKLGKPKHHTIVLPEKVTRIWKREMVQ